MLNIFSFFLFFFAILSSLEKCLFRSSVHFIFFHLQHMEVSRPEVESELQMPSTLQPQQHQIPATSASYSATSGNAGSLTHRARSGTEPISSRTLCLVFNRWAAMGTPSVHFFLIGLFFAIKLHEIFVYLEINSLSTIPFAKVFLPFCGLSFCCFCVMLLLSLFMISFAMQKLLSLTRSH